MDIAKLNEAFQDFAVTSKSLESSYEQLREKVRYLTSELELKNQQLAEALADAERNKDYLKAVLYNLEEAIVAVDPEGCVTMMNCSAERMFGIKSSDALGRAFTSLDFSVEREGPDSVLTVQGKRMPVIMSRSDVVDAEGFLRGRVVLTQDITRLRELEARHERNQRLIAMGEMAAKLVHEIRNPLCSVELYASMLARDLDDPARRELAEGITAGIGSLNTILTNMLLFARPHKPRLSPVRLDVVAEESVKTLTALAESRRVTISHSLPPLEVKADGELLKQVFVNLLINALQALPDGGSVALSSNPDGELTVVHIADTGAGIPREHLEKIFDPFFTTKETGTGLGLVIASNIMQANGGFIKVKSDPGAGSVFSLYFPAYRNGALAWHPAVAEAAIARSAA